MSMIFNLPCVRAFLGGLALIGHAALHGHKSAS